MRHAHLAASPGRGTFAAMARHWFVCAFLAAVGCVGCGDDDDDDDTGPGLDSGLDSGVDAGVDAGRDAGPDAGLDAGPDAGSICGHLERQEIATELRWPVYAVAPPGDDRIFLLERLDSLVVLLDEAGTVAEPPFLDLSDRTDLEGFEAGLLGLAFHPQFADNGLVYVSYTSRVATLRVVRFTVPADTPGQADRDSALTIIDIPTPSHHNVGGILQFGPDGMLYIGVGDNLTEANGQDLGSLDGKLLRIDVDAAKGPYAVPPDNPFVGVKGAQPEIWAYGLREPYRIDFDDETGDLYITDVGEDLWEEIEVMPAGSSGGDNFGWSTVEGPVCHTPREGCDTTGLVEPAYAYSHDEGTAVMGGALYRGTALPECWRGRYFFGDYPTGWIRTMRWDPALGVSEVEQHDELTDGPFVSFGVDGHGEILIVSEGAAHSSLARIVAPGQ